MEGRLIMKVVGVTSCPSGVAHTYMAADAIEAAAKKLGYKSKIGRAHV